MTSTHGGRWVGVLCVDSDVLGWGATVASFSAACDEVVITVAAPYVYEAEAAASLHPNATVVGGCLSDVLAQPPDGVRAFVVVREPAVVAPDAFTEARRIVDDDLRVATVSFFSNDAAYLSIPERNRPQTLAPSGMNEVSMTEALRAEEFLVGPVPIPVPAGVVVAITATAIRSLGSLNRGSATTETALLDLALRGVSRGMRNVLDPATYVLRVSTKHRAVDAFQDPVFRSSLHSRYHFFPSLYDHTAASDDEPLASAITLARTSVEGMSVLVDASFIGPFEMGTQVQTLNLIRALADQPGIKTVHVGLSGPTPAYAEPYLKSPKINIVAAREGRFDIAEQVDVLHRPCQPDGDTPWEHWREISRRCVITVQDLIAYSNGAYFPSPEAWLHYRDNFRTSMRAVDGVITISNDVAGNVAIEQMPFAPGRVRVIPNGADHNLVGTGPARPPAEMVNRSMLATSFIFMLGASYAHKNRDRAIEAWRELRSRGSQHRLVMAGVVVPHGSTRNEETKSWLELDGPAKSDIVILPDVSADERHWLLSHASLVLYPTSAEGFGLVPFEAAQCDTATLFVPFGPLAEVYPDVPVVAADWSAEALADAAEKLLNDPAVSRAQVDSIRAAAKRFTWGITAEHVVRFYRELLSQPALGR